MEVPTYTYTAFGLTLHSELELPELGEPIQGASPGKRDVAIRFGKVVRLEGDTEPDKKLFYATPDYVIYVFPAVGRMRVTEGAEIVVDPFPETEPRVLRLFILGISLATLLHQRGHLVLHASSISIEGSAIIFLGGKGYGKSTIAATLCQRGHLLVTDDIAPVEFLPSDRVGVYAGFPQLKLWPDAAVTLGKEVHSLRRLHPEVDKLSDTAGGEIAEDLTDIRSIYVLEYGDCLEATPIKASSAFQELVRHTFMPNRIRQFTETREVHFEHCTTLLDRVPMYRLRRPKDISTISQVAKYVEEHVAKLNNSQ